MNTTFITSGQIERQVFLAIDDDGYLPIGEKIVLEVLDNQMDGIFPFKQSWRAFVRGNFIGVGDYFLSEVKESTIKRWCYDPSEYIGRFVVQVGIDKFIKVNPDEIELTYDFDTSYWTAKEKQDGTVPDIISIYVTANIKGQ